MALMIYLYRFLNIIRILSEWQHLKAFFFAYVSRRQYMNIQSWRLPLFMQEIIAAPYTVTAVTKVHKLYCIKLHHIYRIFKSKLSPHQNKNVTAVQFLSEQDQSEQKHVELWWFGSHRYYKWHDHINYQSDAALSPIQDNMTPRI